MLNASQLEYADIGALMDDYADRGWTDGLPVVELARDDAEAIWNLAPGA